MTWSLGWAHEQGQGCVAESQSCATIENGESLTASGIALELPIGWELQSHLVIVALNRQGLAWLCPEEVQEIETLRRDCSEARRRRNESCWGGGPPPVHQQITHLIHSIIRQAFT